MKLKEIDSIEPHIFQAVFNVPGKNLRAEIQSGMRAILLPHFVAIYILSFLFLQSWRQLPRSARRCRHPPYR